MKHSALLTAALPFLAGVLYANNLTTYHQTGSIPVPGDGGWDYLTLDASTRRLYISHSNQTQILDVDKRQITGSIPETNGVHGIALAPELGRGFISAGADNQVVIFDIQSLKRLGVVKTGTGPDAIVYDPTTQKVFAFNGGSQSATVFSAMKIKGTRKLALGGRPEFAVADGQGKVYVDLEDKSELLQIDAKKMSIENRWPLDPCKDPSSLAVDRTAQRLFVGCRNKLMAVVDAGSGKVVATLPIGEHVDATVYDPETRLIFNANGDGTITIFQQDSPDQYRLAQTVTTERGARTIAMDPTTHRVFLPLAQVGDAPTPTPQNPHPRRPVVKGTFHILVFAP